MQIRLIVPTILLKRELSCHKTGLTYSLSQNPERDSTDQMINIFANNANAAHNGSMMIIIVLYYKLGSFDNSIAYFDQGSNIVNTPPKGGNRNASRYFKT